MLCALCADHFSHGQLTVIPWTVVLRAPLSRGFSKQEYWSGLPFPPPGHQGLNQGLFCPAHWPLGRSAAPPPLLHPHPQAFCAPWQGLENTHHMGL